MTGEKGIFTYYHNGDVMGFEVECHAVTRIANPGAGNVVEAVHCPCGADFDIEGELRQRISKERKANGRPKLRPEEPGDPDERLRAARELPVRGCTIRFL